VIGEFHYHAFKERILKKNRVVFEKFEKFANSKSCTPAQIALAWIFMKGGDNVIPLVGTTKISHLDENLGSLNVKLTESEVKELEDMMDKIEGLRYDEYSLSLLNK